jgi:hypothetical protein
MSGVAVCRVIVISWLGTPELSPGLEMQETGSCFARTQASRDALVNTSHQSFLV